MADEGWTSFGTIQCKLCQCVLLDIHIQIMYTYDANGNIVTKYIKATGETIEYKYEDARCADLLTSYNGIPVTYDEENPGNLASYGNIRYSYEGRRLTKYENAFYTITYTYNVNGLRVRKDTLYKPTGSLTVTQYTYEGDRLLYEKTGTNWTRFVYDDNGLLYGFVYNGIRYYYVRDLQQNIVKIVDETGQYVAGYVYESYGVTTELQGDVEIARLNPFRYKGYYYDADTGYFYCNSRYYNPYWGRWLTADDVSQIDPESIGGLNLFAYCCNDPINRVDPSGQKAKWWQWALVGVAVVGLVAATVWGLTMTGLVVGSVISGASMGALAGMSESIIEQTKTQGLDNVDLGKAAVAGVIGAAIGAVSGAISGAVESIGIDGGSVLGGLVEKMTVCGVPVAKVFGKRVLPAVGGIAGKIAGAFIGGVMGNEVANNLFGKYPDDKENVQEGVANLIMSWISEFIRWLRV